MSEINDGGPAFPVADPFAVRCPPTDAEALRLQQGMTLRDYFAAKAMQGLIASHNMPASFDMRPVALKAYIMADAMLAARSAT